jgi:hypothetical protein
LLKEIERDNYDSTVFFIDNIHVYIQWEGMYPRDMADSEGVDREEQP